MNLMDKDIILREFYSDLTKNSYNKNKLKDKTLVDALFELTHFLSKDSTVSERLFCLKNNLFPKLCECGSITKFISPAMGYAEFCSKKCTSTSNKTKEKRKKTTIESNGGLGFSSQSIKEKIKTTNLEKYGVENAASYENVANKISEAWKYVDKNKVLEKRKKTNVEKYGVEHHQQNQIQKEKIKNNIIKIHDGIGFSSKKIQNKIKNSILEKYGVENVMNNTKVQDKLKNSILEKYGVENAMQSSDVISKRRKNNIEKWGVENNSQRHISKETLETLSSNSAFEQKLKVSGGAYSLSKELEVSIHTIMNKIKEFGIIYESQGTFTSSFETEILNFLSINDVPNLIQSDRKILNGKELDIVIPDKKICIEMNGVYWHSENSGNKDKFYHYNKTEVAKKAGYQLLHIYDVEWLHKNNIIKSMILSKIGKSQNKVHARKCIILEINPSQKNQFLIENHLQGKDTASINLGLFFNNELVAVMTFGKSRFSKKYQWELVRFANKKFTHVVGGASKLLRYFINKYNPCSIVTYADKRYSDGTFYEKIGFTKLHESEPNYHYWKSNNPLFDNQLFSRNRFQKHKLKNILENFDSTLSEWDNMKTNGYDRIWDCGNYVFSWKNTQ